MDLGAFLKPGLSLALTVEADDREPSGQGWLTARRGRPRWVLERAQSVGRVLNINLQLPGFTLAEDGALTPAAPEDVAGVTLLGQVRASRFWPARGFYVLSLKILGRVWPQ